MEFYLYFLPGTFAFVIVIVTTYLIEKCGPIIGGLVAALPHLVVVNTIFIIINSPNVTNIKEALFTIPTGIIAEGLFLVSWKYMPSIITFANQSVRLCILILSSFLCWSIAPLTLALFFEFMDGHTDRDQIIPYVGISCAVLTLIIGFIATLTDKTPPNQNESSDYVVNWKIYIARGIAVIITATLCNYLASVGLGILSGFMSVFPALFSVTIISFWIIHGDQLPTQSAGALLLGITGVNIFALMTAWLYLYEKWYIAYALLISWTTAIVLGGIPMFFFMKYIEKRNEKYLSDEYKRFQTQQPTVSVQQSTIDIFNMDESMDA
eukprot:269815_1